MVRVSFTSRVVDMMRAKAAACIADTRHTGSAPSVPWHAFRSTLVAWVGLAVGCCLSVLVFQLLAHKIDEEAQLRFESQASDAENAIETRILSYVEVIRGLSALFHTSDVVSRQQFHHYVAGLDLTQHYPGFQNMNYAQFVPAEDRTAFEAQVRQDTSLDPNGYPGFAIRPAGQRDAYVLTYLEPMESNLVSFGLDIAAQPAVREALVRSRDTGELMSSGRLIHVGGANKHIGLAMRFPVYRNGMPLTTVEERRAAYLGSIGAGIHVQNLMRGVLDDAALRYLRFRMYDAGPVRESVRSSPLSSERLLFDSDTLRATTGPDIDRAHGNDVFTTRASLTVAGRTWELLFNVDKHGVIPPFDRLLPWLVLGGGLLASALLFWALYSAGSARRRAMAMARMITKDLRESENALRHVASHDALTGLPNRTLFNHALQQALHQQSQHGAGLAVLFIDLDRFKAVNDTLGHSVGDQLLQECAAKLTACVRKSDMVARFGGDEFVLIIDRYSANEDIVGIVEKILHALAQPMSLHREEVRVGASIGISTSPADGSDVETLVKNADTAMYRAKADGSGYRFYSAQMNSHNLQRFSMEASLYHAIERQELLLHYQPRLNLRDRRIAGVEALVRWCNPALGIVPPAHFIPLAEESDLIIEIGRWVLRTACLQHRQWQRQGRAPARVAVNLSARQFRHAQLLEDVTRILDETGIAPTCLELEITESMVMQNAEQAIHLLRQFKTMGIRLSIDDFGTGYSSLAYLRQLPVDCVKIDRSFIRNVPHEPDDMAITRAIITLGHSLRLEVTAEGIETLEQLNFLAENRCDEIQGYFFSKPVPPEEITVLLEHDGFPVSEAVVHARAALSAPASSSLSREEVPYEAAHAPTQL